MTITFDKSRPLKNLRQSGLPHHLAGDLVIVGGDNVVDNVEHDFKKEQSLLRVGKLS